MKIYDPIYGTFDLEPVLVDLINASPIQRLKKIHQGGASYLVNPKWNVTRFDHSVGVMLLVKKLGAPIEEQIAALLHDISHTAFSHVVDFVLNNSKQNFHDEIFEHILLSSEVPSILKGHGFNLSSILPIDKWSVLEQPLPFLCADRIDYTLRDLYFYDMITLKEATLFINQLKVVRRQICINSIEDAEWFVKTYYMEVIDFFLNPLNVYGYSVLTDILIQAIDKKIIYFTDLLLDDPAVWKKLNESADPWIRKRINDLQKTVTSDEKNYDLHQKKKVRIIDPLVLVGDMKLKRASELSKYILELNQQALKKSLKGVYVKVLDE